jgi:hypothetical protein
VGEKPMGRDRSITRPSISFALKLAYTAFVAIHVWFNWRVYGPLNFLWECDVAILVILVALWTENRLLTSMAALSSLVPMGLWMTDIAGRVFLGHYIFGFAGYMFDRRVPKMIRMISAFHLWLPLLLIWMLMKLGYDRRAFWMQSLFMAVLLIFCRIISQPPPERSIHQPVNINWVYGTSDLGPQTKLPSAAYLLLMIVLYPTLIYLPSHVLLKVLFGKRSARRPAIMLEHPFEGVTAA